jgi:hypothetical protein
MRAGQFCRNQEKLQTSIGTSENCDEKGAADAHRCTDKSRKVDRGLGVGWTRSGLGEMLREAPNPKT